MYCGDLGKDKEASVAGVRGLERTALGNNAGKAGLDQIVRWLSQQAPGSLAVKE